MKPIVTFVCTGIYRVLRDGDRPAVGSIKLSFARFWNKTNGRAE